MQRVTNARNRERPRREKRENITFHLKMKDKQKVIRTRIKTNKRMNSKYEKKL